MSAAEQQTSRSAERPVLEATGLAKSFGGMRVVDGMSLALAPGEMAGLIGPNGAGKTTVFNLLAGSLKPDAGSIRLKERDVTADAPQRRLASGLGRTFQIPRPFSEMTVLENVLTAVQHQSGERVLSNVFRPFRVAKEERASVERAREILEFVSLTRLADEPARKLSGGQRKLLELARVLIADPAVLLLDEPAAGVNPALLDLICDRIIEINRTGVSILLIEHNMEMVERLCGRVVVMAAGQMLVEGTPAEIAANEEVVGVYLGEVEA
ncbi:ABC transporter ATP-binding protein [Amorphus orientalis]|uniref:Branched-chain amino acid transport system ATP-binding protein n=1 Tax=Amorphus orientalis TaxID=649198 RepID=A0AAE3VPG5_9HYPH|nr:ABC transporter ATP-binding protein [Amorphus orientalis]MDQ0315385.1 branched-chain amino acid transport system ATP-binding protein [Amorphus orientalis]